MFTYELSRRLDGTGVTVNALHPGVVSTSFGAEDPTLLTRMARPLMRFMKHPPRARPPRAASHRPDVDAVTGQYFANSTPKTSNKSSYDTIAANRLWRVSADLVGLAPRSSQLNPGGSRPPGS